jgi:ABC-type nitrate/sulfonate/bicarbonate transport system substrate-binding protein
VLVPDGHNLQYLSFWVAKGAGFFAAEGATLAIVTPPSPALATSWMREHKAPVGVLSPPTYVELISTREPIVLGFNLLRNEPIALVVRKDVAAERRLDPSRGLREKLGMLKGIRIGVAPHPTVRLRQLLAAEGLDADRDMTISVVPGRSQNEALRSSQVDALFAHTPFLEEAIVEDGAMLIVDGPRGESPALAVPQGHALVFERTFLERNAAVVAGMGRALVHANRLVQKEPALAVEAVLHEFPEMKRSHVEMIVRLYAPSMPDDVAMTVEGVRARLPLLPAAKAPSLEGIDLTTFVDPGLGRAAIEASKPTHARTALWMSATLLLAAAIVFFVWRRLVVRRGRP